MPGGSLGGDHDELSGFIRDRAIVHFAIAQQFHRCARRRPARDDGFARRLDAGNVECRHAVAAFRWRCGAIRSARPPRRLLPIGPCCERRLLLLSRVDAGFEIAARPLQPWCRPAARGGRTEWRRQRRRRQEPRPEGWTIRLIDMAVMMLTRLPESLARPYFIPSRAGWVLVCVRKTQAFSAPYKLTASRRAGTARTSLRIRAGSCRLRQNSHIPTPVPACA